MRKIAIVISFFAGTPLMVLFLTAYLLQIGNGWPTKGVLGASTNGIAYAALPPTENTIEPQIVEKESKQEILRQFFAKYNSPLQDYSEDIIAASERYNIDYRLLPAIAMQESNLCKKIIKDSYNCWGWGIYGTKVTKFNNYPEAIETITRTLSTKYREKGLVTPFEIAKLYNPSNTNNWAEHISLFMNQLK